MDDPPVSPTVPGPTRRTRFVCISDTHNCTVKLPKGDVLVHCGDLTNQGSFQELKKQVAWLESADFECKIVVGGNHDLTLDAEFFERHADYFRQVSPQKSHTDYQNILTQSNSLLYLVHESRTIKLTSSAGPRTTFSVFGSPYTPAYGSWAFQYSRSDLNAGEKVWKDIPLNTDILITHGPPRTHNDRTLLGDTAGCEILRQAMWRVRPRIALCGHIHEARGVERVRWDLSGESVRYKELAKSYQWEDPGVGNEKNSLVDLTSRRGAPLDNDGGMVLVDGPVIESTTGNDATTIASGTSAQNLTENAAPTRGDGARLPERLGRRETCIVNCAIQATSYPHSGPRRLHKPIVIDIDLPVWGHNP
ncbi:Metallo-dependent phosphatase [Durotheca rogersii]|uniref:Metallo-dependent phosphatase n=1 Tax=Durotheca rogersii TaxID=419775 RepID=UPI00222105F1|nr:Metallo-dependent phosphatase [Durotheca rogersii]KAI5865257.1 Metallo-dependent phosphatase [Durotheca rogersii]